MDVSRPDHVNQPNHLLYHREKVLAIKMLLAYQNKGLTQRKLYAMNTLRSWIAEMQTEGQLVGQ